MLRLTYYAIFDPSKQLEGPVLQVYKLEDGNYVTTTQLEELARERSRLGLAARVNASKFSREYT